MIKQLNEIYELLHSGAEVEAEAKLCDLIANFARRPMELLAEHARECYAMCDTDNLVDTAATWHKYRDNWELGNFATKLINAWSSADVKNRKRLAIAFPNLTSAMDN